jgi:hypothetical protein
MMESQAFSRGGLPKLACSYNHVRVSADESCVKLPLRGVCGKLRLPGGADAAAYTPAGRIQTPRSGSFYHVMSADTAAKKFAEGRGKELYTRKFKQSIT